jgi:hypothetical protein
MNMNITQANYYSFEGQVAGIAITLTDGSFLSVPRKKGNRHYDAIVAATATDGSFWGDTVPEPMATEAATWLVQPTACSLPYSHSPTSTVCSS